MTQILVSEREREMEMGQRDPRMAHLGVGLQLWKTVFHFVSGSRAVVVTALHFCFTVFSTTDAASTRTLYRTKGLTVEYSFPLRKWPWKLFYVELWLQR